MQQAEGEKGEIITEWKWRRLLKPFMWLFCCWLGCLGDLWRATAMFSPTTTGETRDGAKEDEQEDDGERTAMNHNLQLL